MPPNQRLSETHLEAPLGEGEKMPWFTTTLLSVLLAVVVFVGSVVVENLELIMDDDAYSTALVVVDGARRGRLVGAISGGLRKIRTSIVNVMRPVVQRLPLGMGAEQQVYSTAVTLHENTCFFQTSDGSVSLMAFVLMLASCGGLLVVGMTIMARLKMSQNTRK